MTKPKINEFIRLPNAFRTMATPVRNGRRFPDLQLVFMIGLLALSTIQLMLFLHAGLDDAWFIPMTAIAICILAIITSLLRKGREVK